MREFLGKYYLYLVAYLLAYSVIWMGQVYVLHDESTSWSSGEVLPGSRLDLGHRYSFFELVAIAVQDTWWHPIVLLGLTVWIVESFPGFWSAMRKMIFGRATPK